MKQAIYGIYSIAGAFSHAVVSWAFGVWRSNTAKCFFLN